MDRRKSQTKHGKVCCRVCLSGLDRHGKFIAANDIMTRLRINRHNLTLTPTFEPPNQPSVHGLTWKLLTHIRPHYKRCLFVRQLQCSHVSRHRRLRHCLKDQLRDQGLVGHILRMIRILSDLVTTSCLHAPNTDTSVLNNPELASKRLRFQDRQTLLSKLLQRYNCSSRHTAMRAAS